jgi:hypothetical protein
LLNDVFIVAYKKLEKTYISIAKKIIRDSNNQSINRFVLASFFRFIRKNYSRMRNISFGFDAFVLTL